MERKAINHARLLSGIGAALLIGLAGCGSSSDDKPAADAAPRLDSAIGPDAGVDVAPAPADALTADGSIPDATVPTTDGPADVSLPPSMDATSPVDAGSQLVDAGADGGADGATDAAAAPADAGANHAPQVSGAATISTEKFVSIGGQITGGRTSISQLVEDVDGDTISYEWRIEDVGTRYKGSTAMTVVADGVKWQVNGSGQTKSQTKVFLQVDPRPVSGGSLTPIRVRLLIGDGKGYSMKEYQI